MVSQSRGGPVPRPECLRKGRVSVVILLVLGLLISSSPELLKSAPIGETEPLLATAPRAAGVRSAQESHTWLEQFKATAGDAGAAYWFGHAVAIDGDTALIGAWSDEGGVGLPLQDVGAAYIFERSSAQSNDWHLVTKLTASDGQPGDAFGTAVALDGDTALVGARMEDGGPDDPTPNAGAVYVFQRDHEGPDAWGEVTKLTAGDAAEGDYFGQTLALDNDTALVGAWLKDKDSDLPAAGAAYIFQRHWGASNAWGQVAKLSGAQLYGHFATDVALHQDMALIGAENEDDGDGAAYVYRQNPNDAGAWDQVARLTPGDAGGNADFGWVVALYGDTALVGAYRDDEGANNAGAAYIFQRDWGGENAWGQVTKLIARDARAEDWFGMDLALHQDLALVGAYRHDGDGDPFTDFGAAYLFQRHQGGTDAWGQVAMLAASDPTPDARFGWSVALHDSTLLVGAERADGGDGATYWFAPGTSSTLQLTKSVSPPSPLLPGEPLTYTLDFANEGPGIATGVVITDSMPGAVTGVNHVSSGVPLTNTTAAPALGWSAGDLSPGAAGTITLTGVVSPLLSAGTSLTNVARISASGQDAPDSKSDAVRQAVILPRVSFAAPAFTVAEDEPHGTATITVTLDAPNPFAGAGVAYETADGSAVAGRDYIATTGRVTIPAGQDSAAFDVPIVNNNVDRGGRFLRLVLTDPHGAAPGAIAEATLTIIEDDHAAITVSPTALVLVEGHPADSYTVALHTEPTAAVTLTMAADAQITLAPAELTFSGSNWNVAQTVTVSAVDDGVAEGAHNSRITHRSHSQDPNYDGLAVDDVVVQINDTAHHSAYLPLLRSAR